MTESQGMPHHAHDCTSAHGPSRGQALAALAALAAGAVLGTGGASAQSGIRLVDVHHHFYPKPLLDAMQAWQGKHGLPPLAGPVPAWTPARTLEEMDKNGIATAMLELASPHGVWFDVDPAAVPQLSRTCNEFAAGLVRDHPGRFGLFASLPMPNVAASLQEIAYAFDTLKADGIGLPTSFGDKYPGEKAYAPVFEELNRRKALVVFHPYAPNCCGTVVSGVAESILEYPYDTGRAVLSLLVSGTFARYRDIRWVLPHGGGAVPTLAGRIVTFVKGARNIDEIAPNGIDYELKRLYYDTANAAYAPTMGALMAYVPPSQILFGTDFPYVSGAQNVDGLMGLKLPPATLAAIARGNIANLLPRFRG
jgi:predicted TIM-barrel fold metal-dependent hydrolase